VRATRATSIVIVEAYTLSLAALMRRCHFEEVALRKSLKTFAMVSMTSTHLPLQGM
jgi:hypothetical protein